MKLLWHAKRIDADERIARAKKGYGCAHPERITGFAGAFLKTHPDVYISDGIERLLADKPAFAAALAALEERFEKNDYGLLPEDDALDQLFNVYTRGCCWALGAYQTEEGVIVYEIFLRRALFYFPAEQAQASRMRTEEEAALQAGLP